MEKCQRGINGRAYRVINPVLLATSALNEAALCFAAASSILASRKLLLLSASSDSTR